MLVHWEALLCFFVVTTASSKFAPNTHVRAEMGDAVFDCFLPDASKWEEAPAGAFARLSPRESLLGARCVGHRVRPADQRRPARSLARAWCR
jgi:hypothetical protein